MMKLFYSAGSCSTSCHMILEEAGLQYTAIEVDWDNESDPNVALVTRLNGLGTLPVLLLEDGKHLDQNLAIHTYVADLAADRKLLPPIGTFERAQAMNWLSFVAADLHKSIGALFSLSGISPDPAVRATVRTHMLKGIQVHLQYLESSLAGKDYLLGKVFTPADAYAFVVLGWTKWLEISLDSFPTIVNYMARIAQRPAIARVLKAEGLD